MYSLDIETAPKKKFNKDGCAALEPYRVHSDEAEITALSIWGPEGLVCSLHYKMNDFIGQITHYIYMMHGKEVYCTNTIFDVSFLIATIGKEKLKPIRWRDTAILNKWLVNGQKADELRVSYSLANTAKRYLKTWDKLEEFLDVKKQKVTPGEDFDYWLERNILDAEATYLIAEYLHTHLHKMDNYRGYVVTSNAIFPIAEGYVRGIPIHKQSVQAYKKELMDKQKAILKELRVEGTVLTSIKQLSQLLFDDWGLQPQGFTPKGKPSTSAENMLKLQKAYGNERPELNLIMEYKTCATMMSKYVKGFEQSELYLGKSHIHSQPRLLSTVTGRMTYSTKFFKKYQTSIALHQLPRRDKHTKRCMQAPAGFKVLYMDFSAQESRIMADVAEDSTMLNAYHDGLDLHSVLTEEIFGTPYDVVVKANTDGKPDEIVEQRQAGKLTGLSSFYRIGAPALAGKFFTTYGYTISVQTAASYLKSFKRKYPGVVDYWRKAIESAKSKGYAEAFGGWRYKINKFGWSGESAAINHPIQGGGSMLTYAAIAVISKKWPQVIMVSQVHDSLAYFIPEDGAEELGEDILRYMNQYDYGALLGFNAKLNFPLDGAIGDNFADLTEIKI